MIHRTPDWIEPPTVGYVTQITIPYGTLVETRRAKWKYVGMGCMWGMTREAYGSHPECSIAICSQ